MTASGEHEGVGKREQCEKSAVLVIPQPPFLLDEVTAGGAAWWDSARDRSL